MTLYETIIATYPELADINDFKFWTKTINLQDDSDGKGAFIAIWNYEKPIPDGLKLGK
jgi:hypothetical protein